MHDSNFPEQSCRLRRRSWALRAVPTTELHNVSDVSRRHEQSRNSSGDRDEQLSAIASLQLRLECISSPEQALDLIVQEALVVSNAEGAAIAIALEDGVTCRARAGHLSPPVGTVIQAGSGLAGECLQSGEVICCNDTGSDARADAKACQRSGIRSVLAVPLQQDAQVIGIVIVFSGRPTRFGYSEARILQALADLASEPRILGISPGSHSIETDVRTTFTETPTDQKSTTGREDSSAMSSTNILLHESQPRFSISWTPAKSREISKYVERIRQDAALQLLGRAKAYLTIEALHDGHDRSHPIELFEELMLQRAAEIGIP